MAENIRFTAVAHLVLPPGVLGFPADLPYPEWEAAFATEPARYFDAMLDGMRAAGLGAVELSPDPGGWQQALAAYGTPAGFRDALAQRGLLMSSSFASGKKYVTTSVAPTPRGRRKPMTSSTGTRDSPLSWAPRSS